MISQETSDKMDILVWNTILDFIPTKQLPIFLSLNHTFKDSFSNYVYYRFASEHKQLRSNQFLEKMPYEPLLKTVFTDPTELETIQSVLQLLQKNPNICISGGFVTYLYLKKIPPKTSDIDVFILGTKNKNNYKQILKSFYTIFGYLEIVYETPTIQKHFQNFHIRFNLFLHNVKPFNKYLVILIMHIIVVDFINICFILHLMQNIH
jgi:hypothetical protein